MKNISVNCLLVFILIFYSVGNSNAQDKKLAEEYFLAGNFSEAYEQYALLLETFPDDLTFNYRIAVCILNQNEKKQEAIPYLEFLSKQADADPNSIYLLGRAYHYDYQFVKAMESFKLFIKNEKGSEQNLKDAGRQIEYCQNAVELMKFPVDIKFENLGNNVNSPYADYFPFAATDESFLLFNSRNNNGVNQKSDGTNASDIFISIAKNGSFTKAKTVNKKLLTDQFDEEIVGLSSSNKKAVLYLQDKNNTGGKLVLADVRNNNLTNPMKLPENINTRFDEISASINNESKEIYFASNKPGGFGGTDLYVVRLLPNGDWGEPQNLGATINTIYDEDFPVLSSDGKFLYFSSKGHTSMGGYDIFKAEYDHEKMKYMHPRNLGFPINSPMDEMNFSVSESGRYGYISAVRKDGFGDLDIYRITFTDIEPDFTIFNGKIQTSDGNEISSISMFVTNEETGELYGEYLPNLNSMRYVIILPPGKYSLTIEAENYEVYEEKIDVLDKDAFQFQIDKDIQLQAKQ